MDWYAVNTKPRQEKVAEANLRQLGVETFCPQLKREKWIRRKWQTVVGPLFPGYLFARFDAKTQLRAVKYARGVRRIVGFGPAPVRVDEGIIESIRSRIRNGYVTVQPSAPLAPGQAVRIHGGPLEGLRAVFEREMSDRQRVVLLLQALSYQARVVVARGWVAAL